jgi:4-amino-4-deoxy-L-arabinose transferase-like glycosyltransferase
LNEPRLDEAAIIVIQGEGFGFAPLARFIARLGKTGTLDVVHDRWHGQVLFESGRPVAAAIGGQEGFAALDFIALVLDGGEFEFCDNRVPMGSDLGVDAEELWRHLEALDASRAPLAGRIPAPNAVPKFADEPDDPDPLPAMISRQTLAVLLEIDGKRSVQDIAARRGLSAAITALVTLAELGLIVTDVLEPTPSVVPPVVSVDINLDPDRVHTLPVTGPGMDHPAGPDLADSAPPEHATSTLWAHQRWAPWVLPLAVGLVTLLIHGHRLSAAPDILADEGLYLLVGNNLARGAGLVAPGGTPFFWHPPVYLLVEAGYIKLAGLSDVDPVSALYSVRWLNVFFSAATAALLLLLGRNLHSHKVGLLMAGIFLLDPYVQRINRRGMLETLAMLLALIGLYVFFSARQRLTGRQELAAGVALGLAILTKELLAFELIVILACAAWSRRSHMANALKVLIIACLVYLIYPIWAFAVGQGDMYVWLKLQRLEVFLKWSNYWSRLNGQTPPEPGVVLNTGSGAPFVENVLAVLGQYATSYTLIALGGLLTVVLLLHFRSRSGARCLATWAATSYGFIGFGLLFGTLSDQLFYYLIIPSIAVNSYAFVIIFSSMTTAAAPRWAKLAGSYEFSTTTRNTRRTIAYHALRSLIVVTLISISLYDTYQWFEKYQFGIDDSYAKIFGYVKANIPPGETISVGDDVSNYFLPDYRIDFHRDADSVIAGHVQYFILSSKDAWGGYHGMTPAFYNWAMLETKPIIEEEGSTFWKLGLYYRDPSQSATRDSDGL